MGSRKAVGKSGILVAALSFILVVLLAGPIARDAIGELLLDWTGETNAKFQARALISTLFQQSVRTDDLSPVAYAGANPFGVNTFFEQEVEEWKLHMSMQLLRTAGVKWIRQEIPWSDIEINGKGDFEGPYGETWAKYDRFIGLAQQYGLNIVARIDDPPNWSREDNSVHNRPPDNYEDYGDFVYAFVSRYKGQIKYYQIWNEPNIYPEWGDQPVNAGQYVALLKTAYLRAKEADPGAVVLGAGLAPTFTKDDGTAESDLTFLQKMYDAGAGNYFDIMSAMGYSPWSGPGDRRSDPERVNFSRLRLIREIMVRNGDAAKPIWVSEVGFNALPDDFPGPPTHGKVTRQEQANYTVKAYERAMEEWPWIGVVFYWHLRMVHDENRDQVMYYFGLTDTDFTIHPAYFAYMAMANETPTLRYGYRQEDDWSLTYAGDWQTVHYPQASLGSLKHSQRAGSTLEFSFEGTSLDLISVRAADAGRILVTIDGNPRQANLLKLDDKGRAYVDLQSDKSEWQARIPIARGLSNGVHQVTFTVADGGKPVSIDGLVVQTETTHNTRLGLGLIILAGLGLAGLVYRRATETGRQQI